MDSIKNLKPDTLEQLLSCLMFGRIKEYPLPWKQRFPPSSDVIDANGKLVFRLGGVVIAKEVVEFSQLFTKENEAVIHEMNESRGI